MSTSSASQFPQEDVAGFAGYLLSQWQSLLSSSLCVPDLYAAPVSAGGPGMPAAISPQPGQASASSRHPTQAQHQNRQRAHRPPSASVADRIPAAQAQRSQQHEQYVQLQPAPQQLPQSQQSREPQGFRPWTSRQPSPEAPLPADRHAMQTAAVHALPSSAQYAPVGAPEDARQRLNRTAAGRSTHLEPVKVPVMPFSTAGMSNTEALPWLQSPAAEQPGQGGQGVQAFQPLHQLQSLPGSRRDQSVLQAFETAFLRHVHFAGSPSRSPVQSAEQDQQVRAFLHQAVAACQAQGWSI